MPRSPSWSGGSLNRVSSALARVFALWRTGLPRPVLVLQGGDALNYFGTGLLLPFEIIYLHAVRGFSTATAGLVLATVMADRLAASSYPSHAADAGYTKDPVTAYGIMTVASTSPAVAVEKPRTA